MGVMALWCSIFGNRGGDVGLQSVKATDKEITDTQPYGRFVALLDTLLYLKFLVLWALVLLADFILEFRFEFLWPFWLLLRSVYDSFKYQGLAFSVFFVCIALTSDMICFFFIPLHWLFFAASTYVWVQYVWHTEKGICLPTIILWLLFVYIEAAVRLRDLRHLPFHLDLCRPFAAHWYFSSYSRNMAMKEGKYFEHFLDHDINFCCSIGYPVVTLGFGFKSYVGYRMRQRKQQEVAKENEFYMQLLQQALPLEQPTSPTQPATTHNTSPEKSRGETTLSNGAVPSGALTPHPTAGKNNHRKSLDKGEDGKAAKYSHSNGSVHTELDFIQRLSSINDFDENEVEKDKSTKGNNVLKSGKWVCNQVRENAVNTQREKKNKANKESLENCSQNHKDDYCLRLEADVKRLKADLQSSRQTEQDLRSQQNILLTSEKNLKGELGQLQQDNDNLQSKLHGLVTARQMDKQTISQLERRVQEERRIRGSVEAQLSAERKTKRAEEAAAARAVVMATAAANKAGGCCTDNCRSRQKDLETEGKQLRRELKVKDDKCLAAEREVQSLRQYKESHNDSEILMSALSAMQDKNAHLENSLSAETRIKLDLFSALGEAKRQLEIRESLIRDQGKEIDELKAKIAQVLAVMPTDSFGPGGPLLGPLSLGSSKLRLTEGPCPGCTVSNLDPNATAYTPKNIVTSTEA
uniref:Macoilin n=3 Tax=Timema TaxID=61471 RepID=A0A7R9AM28_TIMSH|nr:unnamed protein product [Timema shepardi]